MLADNVVFNSPILARSIEGRDVIAAIFAQSSSTRGSGAYTAEHKLDERATFLRWEGTMDGHKIESLEVIIDNEQGLIVERTIALRPYPAVNVAWLHVICDFSPLDRLRRCVRQNIRSVSLYLWGDCLWCFGKGPMEEGIRNGCRWGSQPIDFALAPFNGRERKYWRSAGPDAGRRSTACRAE